MGEGGGSRGVIGGGGRIGRFLGWEAEPCSTNDDGEDETGGLSKGSATLVCVPHQMGKGFNRRLRVEDLGGGGNMFGWRWLRIERGRRVCGYWLLVWGILWGILWYG